MAYNYTNPGWNNLNPPALNATNLNNISTLLAALGAAFDNGGDPSYLLGNSGSSSWQTAVANLGQRGIVSTSGAIGTLTVTCDTDYILTAASTVTLPASPIIGQKLTFKNKTTATTTISANAGQTIGTTTSTSFVLYAQEDYVTFEWDGTSIWYVVATNGPVLSSLQNAQASVAVTTAWTAVGNGLTLGTLSAGIYDFNINAAMQSASSISLALGNATTPISNRGYTQNGSCSSVSCTAYGISITSPSTIQAIYYLTSGTGAIIYNSTYAIGQIIARRIG
jgi:hypothetical protein